VSTFPLDELSHTDICARMAAELGGAVAIEYPTDAVFPAPAAASESTLLDAAKTVAWEFCVGETLSQGLLERHRRTAKHPLLRAVWGRLAKDEAVHARFGWIFLEWARDLLTTKEKKEVLATIDRAVSLVDTLDEKVESLPEAAFASISTFGAVGKKQYLREQRELLETSVAKRLHKTL